jgi:hypothetical protein
MLKKTSACLFVLLLIMIFTGAFRQLAYNEFNYSEVKVNVDYASIVVSLNGTYNKTDKAELSVVRSNPYYLKVAISEDSGSSTYAKILSVNLKGKKSEDNIVLSDLPLDIKFKPSTKTNGQYVAFISNNIVLLEDDYAITINVEICNERGCEKQIVSGIFELEVLNYKRNILIDRFLSV